MYRKITCLLMALLLIISMSACSKPEPEPEPEPEPTEEIPWEYQYVGITKAEKMAEDYVVALMWCDSLNEVVGFLEVTDENLVIIEDYAWFLGKKGFDWIKGSTASLTKIVETGQGDVRQVKVEFDNGLFVTIDMTLNSNGEWKVSTREMFVRNWQLKIQKGTKPKIDGIDISKYKVKSDSKYETYVFPYIAPRERTLSQTSDFGDRSIKINITQTDKEAFFEWQPMDTVQEELIKNAKKLVQSVNECLMTDDWDTFIGLFDSSIDTGSYKKMFENGVAARKNISNYVIRDVTNYQGAKFYIISSNIASVQFGISSDWKKTVTRRVGDKDVSEKVDCVMKIKGTIELINVGTDCKIMSISDGVIEKIQENTREY